ncbi:FUN14 domain-containing protein 1 isoform X1 [Trichogramma pretiosum]|uniref:FUN14 domain-containing protein 1 isoform X1 n=2 Tax=Trichogramma pretiosum TaxID=7493 RepID=UPI0006C9B9F4|nr:FUN14 domain-containing protein 1 isoform X1 [Trichogramma pretiosum]
MLESVTSICKRLKMSLPNSKKGKEDANREVSDVAKDAKSFLDKILGDVSKTSASKQIAIGAASGWATGFLTMKVGKVAAFAVGGGIIMLQIAANQGYIKINWDKIQKKADKIADKVEERITGEGPKFMDKMERYVDKKMDKAEQLLKNGETRTRRWYQNLTGGDSHTSFRTQELHVFLVSFAAGVAIGVATGN